MVPVNVGHSHRPVAQQQQICVVTVNANVAILLPVLELLYAQTVVLVLLVLVRY